MPVQGLTVSLTTDPVLIAGSGAPDRGVIRVKLYNRGAGPAYLGGSTSLTTDGFLLSTDAPPTDLVLYPGDVLYGTSTGTIVVNALRANETS